jgi:hypothetical protein
MERGWLGIHATYRPPHRSTGGSHRVENPADRGRGLGRSAARRSAHRGNDAAGPQGAATGNHGGDGVG